MLPGKLIIISSPSGGGKDTVIEKLLSLFPGSVRMTTVTSRHPRPGEVDGINYFFVSENEFKKKIAAGEMLEYNIYAGNYYGTSKLILEKLQNEHQIIFSNIEVNGKHNLDKSGIKHLSIFLNPESLDILKSRIERRGGVTEKELNERLKIAEEEMIKSKDYDFHFVNAEGKLANVVENIEKTIKEWLMR